MIDIGVNLTSTQFASDRQAVLDRAKAQGVSHVILTGTTLMNSQASQNLAMTRPDFLSFTAGVHPHYAKEWTANHAQHFAVMWAAASCVAVGETGLDYFRMLSTRQQQLQAFALHAEAALKLSKPLFLHCRDAYDDFLGVMRDFTRAGGQGVVHCFTGTRSEMEAFVDLGLHIGVTGWVADLRRAGALRDAVPFIPADRLHLETDAPYLIPHNRPGTKPRERNEPVHLVWVAKAVAELRNESFEDLAAACTANSQKLFNLSSTT
jgi:TatD DNase family protein